MAAVSAIVPPAWEPTLAAVLRSRFVVRAVSFGAIQTQFALPDGRPRPACAAPIGAVLKG